MILEQGTLLNNRYRIIAILGQGGMGSVYKAIDENLGVEVAVKDNLFTSDEYARQFRREAVLLATLRHPNLPRVTDHFVIPGQGQYLVMDYIQGEDLRQRMERVGTIPEDEVIFIGAAVCDALSYLNSCDPPIVHRDIKPGNIKITPDGNISLVDFGLAKTYFSSQVTTTGARAMTPGYSPPEQYGTARTDHRTDIFSLGSTLYAALTAATPEDALSRALGQIELTPLRKHTPEISEELAEVIEKSMEVQPEDRYQTAEEFKEALLNTLPENQRAEENYVVSPPPAEEKPAIRNRDGSDEIVKRFVTPQSDHDSRERAEIQNSTGSITPADESPKKRKKGCFLFFLILFLLFGGIGYYVINYFPETTRNAVAQIYPLFYPSTTETATNNNIVAFTPTDFIPATLTPAFVRTPTETKKNTQAVVIIPPTDTEVIPPTATITLTAMPTPLGGGNGEIAFAADVDGVVQIYVMEVNTFETRQITDLEGGACQPSWSPDGQKMIFISPCKRFQDFYPGAAMFIINVDGTGIYPIPTEPGGDYDPDWSPDGKKIAFTSLRMKQRPQIYIYDLESGTFDNLSEPYSRDMQPSWSPDGSKIIFVTERRGNSQVWVMDPDGRNQLQFSHNISYRNTSPRWSPDGQTIIFTQLLGANGIPKLMIAPFDLENYNEYRVTQDQIPMRDADTRSPMRNSPKGRIPSSVQNGWSAVARISRPEAVFRRSISAWGGCSNHKAGLAASSCGSPKRKQASDTCANVSANVSIGHV